MAQFYTLPSSRHVTLQARRDYDLPQGARANLFVVSNGTTFPSLSQWDVARDSVVVACTRGSSCLLSLHVLRVADRFVHAVVCLKDLGAYLVVSDVCRLCKVSQRLRNFHGITCVHTSSREEFFRRYFPIMNGKVTKDFFILRGCGWLRFLVQTFRCCVLYYGTVRTRECHRCTCGIFRVCWFRLVVFEGFASAPECILFRFRRLLLHFRAGRHG